MIETPTETSAARAAASGYRHPAYAASLAEFGTPRHLDRAGGWILERPVPGSADPRDAMGCYPLFACRDWTVLERDLEGLRERLVSLVLVADPFGNFALSDLQRCFPDRLVAFKDHFVTDLRAFATSALPSNHRRNARQALRRVEVTIGAAGAGAAEAWVRLYENLVDRHGIGGMAAFSPASLAAQLAVPGATIVCARADGEVAGMVLFYEQDDVVYYHLGAYSEAGYDARASFAIFARALEYFAERGLAWLDLGAGAGLSGADDGLTRFKRGWATGLRPAYLCGRIFDRDRYAALARATGNEAASYFPAYRRGEFG
jgi:hypothetical protein